MSSIPTTLFKSFSKMEDTKCTGGLKKDQIRQCSHFERFKIMPLQKIVTGLNDINRVNRVRLNTDGE